MLEISPEASVAGRKLVEERMSALDSDVESSHHASSLTKNLYYGSRPIHYVFLFVAEDRFSIESGGVIPYEDLPIQ
ncbi:unnamed protein product [Linum trigynum]|uniref:Uncharacterized protein n=1 Tax=Linum trigynum TaxID=586398 RepID=A0AAV2FHS8_9ROSI